MYKVVQQVRSNVFRKDVIGEILNDHVAKVFDTNAATARLSKELLASSSCVAPIATFEQHKTDPFIAGKITVISKTSKMELVPAM